MLANALSTNTTWCQIDFENDALLQINKVFGKRNIFTKLVEPTQNLVAYATHLSDRVFQVSVDIHNIVTYVTYGYIWPRLG